MDQRRFLYCITASTLVRSGALALLGGGLAACSESTPKQNFNAVDLTGADYAKGFALKDADGKERTLADFKGKVVVLFFGYAQCPDVCPTTMTEMAQVRQQLGKDGDRLQVLLYTFILLAACLLPFIYGMSGWLYLAVAVAVSLGFCGYAFALWRAYSDALARRTFRFSLIHLSVLFATLLVDHYVF